MLAEAPRRPIRCQQRAFPTVIVAVRNEELRRKLVDALTEERCVVLEAESGRAAIIRVISHSRPIHVALIDVRMEPQELVRTLRFYRPNLHAIYVTTDRTWVKQDVHLPHVALSKVREFLSIGSGPAVAVA